MQQWLKSSKKMQKSEQEEVKKIIDKNLKDMMKPKHEEEAKSQNILGAIKLSTW
jgi:hypothetical protein